MHAPHRLVLRLPGLSLRVDLRSLVVGAALLAAIAALGAVSLAAGDFVVPLDRVAAVLQGSGAGREPFVVLTLRLPRLLTGIFAGIAFGVAGASLQSLARNPLASPDLIGFDSGAALGAVATLLVWGGTGLAMGFGAIVGGLGAAGLVFGLSWRGGIVPLRLVLVGIAVGACAVAGTQFLLTRSAILDAAGAQAWLTGSLNARVWTHVALAAFGTVLFVPAALAVQPALARLELGDDLAAALGTRIALARHSVGLVAVLLAAIAVASAGPLPFVALAAAPLAKRLVGTAGSTLLAAGLVGAVIVVGADLAGRLVLAPVQLPAGIFTAVLGAPYLLWLLATQLDKGTIR